MRKKTPCPLCLILKDLGGLLMPVTPEAKAGREQNRYFCTTLIIYYKAVITDMQEKPYI